MRGPVAVLPPSEEELAGVIGEGVGDVSELTVQR